MFGQTTFGNPMQQQVMQMQPPQNLQNLYNSSIFSLQEFYIQRAFPTLLTQQQPQAAPQNSGWGAPQQQSQAQPWGTTSQNTQPAFGQPAQQQPFGQQQQQQNPFGQPQQNPFGQQIPNQQPPTGVTSVDQLNLLQTALDNSRSLRTGTLLEKMRSELLGQQNPPTNQQTDPRSPNSKKLLDSLQQALLNQNNDQQLTTPSFMSQIDHSQVNQMNNSSFKANFDVQDQKQNFSQIGAHIVEIQQSHIDFINPRAPQCKNYTTFPSIEQLQLYTDQQLQQISNFAIYKYENNQLVGSLRFLYPVNITSVNIDQVVNLEWKSCNLTFTQQTGYQLNVPAEVTLYGVQCPIGVDVQEYCKNIQEITVKNGGKLVEFDPHQGIWKFQVDSFMG